MDSGTVLQLYGIPDIHKLPIFEQNELSALRNLSET